MTRRLVTIALVLVTLSGIGIALVRTTGTSVSVHTQPPPSVVEVVALVDGDTFDVRVADVITRIRLAYVRTPPPPRPDHAPACLAADASARLASMIPAGTRLRLTYDQDRSGYPAAEALTTDGRLVNAEIVRAGYAHVVATGLDTPMPRFVGDAVSDAAQDAAANQRGMHSAAIACTVPGQVKTLNDVVATIPTALGPTPTALDLSASADRATVARMAAEELKSAFAQNRQDITWLTLSSEERSRLLTQVQDACDHAAALETLLRNATSVTVNHDVTQASVQRDAARIAKVLADIRKAEADRAARASRRAAAARKAQADALAETRARAEAARSQREKERSDERRSDDSDSRRSESSRASDRSPSSRGD